jgi:hypothetical protein
MAKIWNWYFLKAESAVTPDFTAKLSVCMTFWRQECGFKFQQYQTCNSSLLEALYIIFPLWDRGQSISHDCIFVAAYDDMKSQSKSRFQDATILYLVPSFLQYALPAHVFYERKKAGLEKYSVVFNTWCQLFVCENETKWYTLWHSTQTLQKHSFLSKYQTLPWYTCKCNFIFPHRKSANFHDDHNNSVHLCGNVYQIFFSHIG